MPRKQTVQMGLCLAMGNGSTTEQLGDDFSALADALYEGRVDRPPFNWNIPAPKMPASFSSGSYQPPVAQVFLFWGDDKGEFVKNLTKAERKDVERRVTKLFDEDENDSELED